MFRQFAIASLIAAAATAAHAGDPARDWSQLMQQQLGADIANSQLYIDQMLAQGDLQMQQAQSLVNQGVNNTMGDPQVQAMYQQALQNGYQGSFQQFAFEYNATGGFTQQGVQQWHQLNNNLAQQEMNAWHGHQQAQQNAQNAIQGWQQSYADGQNEAGNVLQGNATYTNPHTGQQALLPYFHDTPPHADQNGNPYVMDQNGNWWGMGPNGWVLMR